MNINYKEAQFEFFPNSGSSTDETNRPHFLAARLTLSVENLVILSIVSIMVLLFSFSLGVERGKMVASRETGQFSSDDKNIPAVADAGMKSLVKSDGKAPEAKAASPQPMKAVLPVEKTKDKAAGTKVLAALSQDSGRDTGMTQALSSAKALGKYTVQIASYKSSKGAQKEAEALKQKGYRDVFVMPKGSHVILCVGNFQNREEADQFGKKKLKSRYQDLRVRSL